MPSYIENKKKNNSSKKLFCLFMSKIILKFYSNFRECSGLKQVADVELNKYKRNEDDLTKVKKEILPEIKNGVLNLRTQNEILQSNLFNAIVDLKTIGVLMNEKRYDDVFIVLSKYDFIENIENKG